MVSLLLLSYVSKFKTSNNVDFSYAEDLRERDNEGFQPKI